MISHARIRRYHGKGLVSTTLYKKILSACNFGAAELPGPRCDLLLAQMDKAVGPHNVYAMSRMHP